MLGLFMCTHTERRHILNGYICVQKTNTHMHVCLCKETKKNISAVVFLRLNRKGENLFFFFELNHLTVFALINFTVIV